MTNTAVLAEPRPTAMMTLTSGAPSDDGADRHDLSAVAQGDLDALARLIERHGRGLRAFVRRFTGRDDSLAEVVQDTWTAVWRHAAGRYRGTSRVSAWFCSIAKRSALARFRRRRLELVDRFHQEGDPMINQSSRRRGMAAVAAAAIAVGTFAAAVATDAAAPPTAPPVAVTVTDAGDPETAVDLTPVATVGQTAVMRSTTAMIGALSGPDGTDSYDISSTDTQRAAIMVAAPDGGMTVAFVVEESTSTANSGSAEDVYSPELDLLQGLPLDMDLDSHGAQTALRAAAGTTPTAEQLAAIATYAALGDTSAILKPAEPVGVGATWTATLRFAADWCDLPIDYTYRLASVTGDQYTIEYTWSADVAPVVVTPEGAAELAGISVAATVNGTGTVDASLAGTSSTLRSEGHYRFVYVAGTAEAVDEYDVWEETITTPS